MVWMERDSPFEAPCRAQCRQGKHGCLIELGLVKVKSPRYPDPVGVNATGTRLRKKGATGKMPGFATQIVGPPPHRGESPGPHRRKQRDSAGLSGGEQFCVYYAYIH